MYNLATRIFFLEKPLIMSPCLYSPLASDWSALLCPDWSTVQHPDWHYPDRCIQLDWPLINPFDLSRKGGRYRTQSVV